MLNLNGSADLPTQIGTLQYWKRYWYGYGYPLISISPANSGEDPASITGPINALDPTNTWIHTALTRKNKILRAFSNGVQIGETVFWNKNVLNILNHIYIGLFSTFAYCAGFRGKMDDICIIKGKALWTENFTPPTTYLPDYKDL